MIHNVNWRLEMSWVDRREESGWRRIILINLKDKCAGSEMQLSDQN